MNDMENGEAPILTSLFGHNTWANLKLLHFCEGLTDAQLDTTAIGGFGSIRETLQHIINSEVSYVERVNGQLPAEPSNDQFSEFAVLKEHARWAGDALLQLALTAHTDTLVRQRPPRHAYQYPLAMLIMQALTHSTEHRTQISAIITQLGLEPPDLSGWQYMEDTGNIQDLGEGAQ